MTSRVIPKVHLCYGNIIALLAPEGLHLSLRIHPWHSNARLFFTSINNLLSMSWREHMALTKVSFKLYYVFGDKITLTALLIRAVASIVIIEVSP
jgi:hypothetical protein